MGIATDEIGLELERIAEAFLDERGAVAAARRLRDADGAGGDALPPFWDALRELGWLGLHLPEEHGGQGATLRELATVLEQLGRTLAPGPFLPAVIASALVDAAGTPAQRKALLPDLASGATLATVSIAGSLTAREDGGGLVVSGEAGAVLGAATADLFLLAAGDDVVVIPRDAVTVRPSPSLDLTRPSARVSCSGVRVADDMVLRSARPVATVLARTLAAAEAAGVARGAMEMGVAYAKERVQFGRVIGSFQAVKHHCANMLVDVELATAAVWLAAGEAAEPATPTAAMAAAAAAALAVPAARRCAKLALQVHGGIGYTWQHDAHVYVRRAQALQSLYGTAAEARLDLAALAGQGVRVTPHLELPPEAEDLRAEVRAFAAELERLPEEQRWAAMVESGYAVPHWPAPWGRAAGAVEQLVIDEELARVPRVELGIGGWVTLTIATLGTPEQGERFVRPSLLGEYYWCQLFSEPGAGSDAAGITTKGVRTDGGWIVTGQKVWTSGAQKSTHGLATVRTDPDAPKHRGITTMIIDMSAPGVDVRPLRDMTGDSPFNEVFLDGVFVPDDDVVGEVNAGWTVARATLGNERLTIGRNEGTVGADAAQLLPLLEAAGGGDGYLTTVGGLVATNVALRSLNLRRLVRAIAGSEPGPEGNVTKLVTAEHGQAVHELALELHGQDALFVDGRAAERIGVFLFSRQNTIGGGTSEISRNQIGERILGLPREPNPA